MQVFALPSHCRFQPRQISARSASQSAATHSALRVSSAGRGSHCAGQVAAVASISCFTGASALPPAARKAAQAACTGRSTAAQPALHVAELPLEQSSVGSSQHSVLTGFSAASSCALLLQAGA